MTLILARKILTAIRNPKLIFVRSYNCAVYIVITLLSTIPAFRRYQDNILGLWGSQIDSNTKKFIFDNLFNYWIHNIYLKETDPDRRVALQLLCMGKSSGVAWAETYELRQIDRSVVVNGIPFDEYFPAYLALENVLKKAGSKVVVVQIGSSSGREMAYFANNFPKASFIGIDIDDEIIVRAAKVHKLPNLKFCRAFAHSFLDNLRIDDDCDLVLWSNGSLQYVQPEHIDIFFANMKRRNIVLIAMENAMEEDVPIDCIHGSRWRGNFSFSHDYKYYAEKNGISTVEYKSITTSNDPHSIHYRTKTYYYHCAS